MKINVAILVAMLKSYNEPYIETSVFGVNTWLCYSYSLAFALHSIPILNKCCSNMQSK